jgi:hypothetical protein
MTYDPERDETPSYEGEVVEEKARMRPRTKVALGGLVGLGVSIIAEQYLIAIGLICAYVAWIFVRTWLAKRRRDRAWLDGGGTIERGGIL